jgi:hypothetical protein
VLGRINDHPATQLADLLAWNWRKRLELAETAGASSRLMPDPWARSSPRLGRE